MQTTTRNGLKKSESTDTYLATRSGNNDNFDVIDERIAKCQFAGTRDPTSNDDVLDGYAVGSLWINQTDGRIFICADATGSAAQWDQIYPNDDADTLDGYHASYFAPATKGVTNGDSHDHSGGDGAQISYTSLSNIPSSFAPSSHASNHQSGGSDSIKLDDLAAPDDTTDLDVSISKHGLCPKLPNDNTKYLCGNGSWSVIESGATFWEDVPGTPTRVSDTQFTVTGDYSTIFQRGVLISWLAGGSTWSHAIVTSSSYSSGTTTVNIVGSSLGSSFTSMKYFTQLAVFEDFIIPGTLAATSDAAKTFYAQTNIYPLACDGRVKTAGSGAATVFDVNDDGSSIFNDSACSIASGNTETLNTAAYAPTTEIAAGSLVTVDIVSVATTPPVEAYIRLWYFPKFWRYLA